MKRNNILQGLLYIIQGAIVGVGAILPGVSGGVLCVAFGIYEPMMELLTHPRVAIKKSYRMFIPFLIGWVLGFLLLARGIEILFAAASEIALMLFFGLICGTMPQLFKDSERGDPKIGWTPFIISLSAAYLFFHILEGGVAMTVAPGFLSFLLCGILWGLSLIVPGFSSSSILIYLGLYEPMTSGIAALDIAVLAPMGIGIAVTALALARLVSGLYKRHYSATSRVVLGFVVASALKALPTGFPSVTSLIISLICFAVGFAIAFAMDRAQARQNDISNKET